MISSLEHEVDINNRILELLDKIRLVTILIENIDQLKFGLCDLETTLFKSNKITLEDRYKLINLIDNNEVYTNYFYWYTPGLIRPRLIVLKALLILYRKELDDLEQE